MRLDTHFKFELSHKSSLSAIVILASFSVSFERRPVLVLAVAGATDEAAAPLATERLLAGGCSLGHSAKSELSSIPR